MKPTRATRACLFTRGQGYVILSKGVQVAECYTLASAFEAFRKADAGGFETPETSPAPPVEIPASEREEAAERWVRAREIEKEHGIKAAVSAGLIRTYGYDNFDRLLPDALVYRNRGPRYMAAVLTQALRDNAKPREQAIEVDDGWGRRMEELWNGGGS